MRIGEVFLVLAAVAAVFGVYFMIHIIDYLSSKGEKVNWFLLRLKWFTYMSKYRELTLLETGETGKYHRLYIVSVIVSLILVITGAFLLSR